MAKENIIRFRCDQCNQTEDFNTSKPFEERHIAALKAWTSVIVENGTQNGDLKCYCTRSCEIIGARQASSITLTDTPKQGETVPGSSLIVAQ